MKGLTAVMITMGLIAMMVAMVFDGSDDMIATVLLFLHCKLGCG